MARGPMVAMVALLVVLVGCSKDPEPPAVVEAPKKSAPSSEPAPPLAVSAPPPAVSAPAEPMSAAMVVCKKLETAGVAPECRPSGSSQTSAKFGEPGSAVSGLVSVFDDRKTFDTISAAMAKDKGQKTATSAKTRTLVVWKSDSADIEKKIRAIVDAL